MNFATPDLPHGIEFTFPNTANYSVSIQYIKQELVTSFKNAVNFAFKRRVARFLHKEYLIPKATCWEMIHDRIPLEYVKDLCNGVSGQVK